MSSKNNPIGTGSTSKICLERSGSDSAILTIVGTCRLILACNGYSASSGATATYHKEGETFPLPHGRAEAVPIGLLRFRPPLEVA